MFKTIRTLVVVSAFTASLAGAQEQSRSDSTIDTYKNAPTAETVFDEDGDGADTRQECENATVQMGRELHIKGLTVLKSTCEDFESDECYKSNHSCWIARVYFVL
ncbi:MAG: hypothetical protein HOE90_22300 [Bacteriovoracaceae bacterium]|jgi:hypothetical protein|nr:hypothetical protein [Bacteriovoracaceae bacterium]